MQAAGCACSPTSENTCSRCRVNKGRAKRLGSGPLVSLVFVHQALAQVEDGRGPKPYEDRRLTLAREVQGQRDEDGDQGTAHVDPFATVHMLYLLLSWLDALYPAANLANRERIASLLGRSSTSENSTSETVWKFSGTRQPPHHQADHCRVDERFCASTKPLVILAHPPVLREPGEGPFHHPPAG